MCDVCEGVVKVVELVCCEEVVVGLVGVVV